LEHVLDAAQTASEIVEDERERAGEVVGEIEELLETQAEKARRSTSEALDDVLAKVQSEVSETVRDSLMKSAKHSLEERLAKAREDLTENALSMSEVARQRFAEEAEHVAQSLREGLLQEIKGAQEQCSGTLDKVSTRLEGSMEEAQRTAKSTFDEHEKQVTQLSESALGKLREQAESVTSEATGQLRESLQSWQDENQKRIQGELQEKVDEIIGGLAQRMNRHAEDTLEMISEELTQKSGKMIEASAETMRNRFAQLFSNVGLSMQQPGEAPQTSSKEDPSKEPSES
jgi:vacuolar-type H+-ATPase subunit E/Vma4